MGKTPSRIEASVRQRLLNLARNDGRDFQTVLVAFGLERLTYRISISRFRDDFVLKGGMLVTLWTSDPGRFTRDIDFLKFGNADMEILKSIFTEILSIDADDGLVFSVDELRITDIREDQPYSGQRLKTIAYLGKTKIPILIDVGTGDAVSNTSYKIKYASLLDFESASLRAYSPETVIAEKFEAVVALGLVNGRMKDYYDLWAIPIAKEISSGDLAVAIKATFERRRTDIPGECPPGLSEIFATDGVKIDQWTAYSEATGLEGVSLVDVVNGIWEFLEEPCRTARSECNSGRS